MNGSQPYLPSLGACSPRSEYSAAGAEISADGRYRYLLWREWRGSHARANWDWLGRDGTGQELGRPKPCLFIMLNPSTADGEHDDPTIRRCVAFSKAWNYERLEVVNLFAHRATDPRALLALSHDDDPVGWQNSDYVTEAAVRAGIVICAWGAHGAHLGQDETVLGWIGATRRFALGLTRDGQPRHPLYLPSDAKPVEFRP